MRKTKKSGNRIASEYGHLLDTLRPPDKRSVSQWCDEHVILSSRDTAEYGPYKTSRTPYARKIMDMYAEPDVRKITLMWAAQVGKTQIAKNMLAWLIDQRPGPVLYVLPTEKEAGKFSRNRIMPMFDEMPILKKHLRASPRDLKTVEYLLDNSLVQFGWSNSPATLASMPMCYIFDDEVGKYPLSSRNEADAVSLAEERVSTFTGRSKIVCTSTPTHPGDLIEREFDDSVQHQFFVPCPHCGEMQTLVFGQVKWPEKERRPKRIRGRRLAWYECAECGGRIEDRDKPAMLEAGEWRTVHGIRDEDESPDLADDSSEADDNSLAEPDDPSHIGFHLNAIYSPWKTFSDVAAKFLESGDSYEKRQNFFNAWLALPFEERVTKLDTKKLHPLAERATLERGKLPRAIQRLTAGVDWHGPKKGYYWSIWAWGSGCRGWLVDYGQVFSLDEIDEALWREFVTDDGRVFIPVVGVDSAYETFEVYSYCKRHWPRARPTKGKEPMERPYAEFAVDYTHKRSGKRITGMMAIRINTEDMKDTLARLLDVERTESEEGDENRIELCKGVEERFLKHLSSEVKVRDRKKGRAIWKPRYKGIDNHWWDTLVGALALAMRAGLLGLRPLPGEREPVTPTGHGRPTRPQTVQQAPAPRAHHGGGNAVGRRH